MKTTANMKKNNAPKVAESATDVLKAPLELPNIDKLRAIAESSRNNNAEAYKKGADLALEVILKNYVEKMEGASRNSRNSVQLYRWQYVADKSDQTYSFNGISVIKLLMNYGPSEDEGILLNKLRNFFNPDKNRNGYRVGFRKYPGRNPNEPTGYAIYVSWAPKKGDISTETQDD
jgi:hypothetical protein